MDEAKKDPAQNKTSDEMIAYYKEWIAKYPFVSIEDPFDQDDWEAYSKFTAEVGREQQIVGDASLLRKSRKSRKSRLTQTYVRSSNSFRSRLRFFLQNVPHLHF